MTLYTGKKIYFLNLGPASDNFTSKMREISARNHVKQKRFPISRFEFFVISLSTGRFRFLIFFLLFFYLITFISSSHKFTKFRYYNINIKITLKPTRICGHVSLDTGVACCGRRRQGSNPGHN